MNTLRFMIMAVGLCLGLCNAAPLLTTPVAESVTEVLLSQRFDSDTAGIEPMGWFAIRSGDGHCVVTRSYAASLAQSFRIGSSPIWDGLYGYGFGTPQGGVVRVEARILCDTIGTAKPYLGVKIGGRFYEMVGDPERALTRWSNGEARWSCGPALAQGIWNTIRIDIDVTRGIARYWLNGRVLLDNSVGVPAPEFARSTEAIYLGVVAGAAGVAYFDDVTIGQVSQQSLPLIQPAQRVAPLPPPPGRMWMQGAPGQPPAPPPPCARMMPGNMNMRCKQVGICVMARAGKCDGTGKCKGKGKDKGKGKKACGMQASGKPGAQCPHCKPGGKKCPQGKGAPAMTCAKSCCAKAPRPPAPPCAAPTW